MNGFTLFIFGILAIIVGFLIVKRVATCMIKSIVLIVLIAILILLSYFGTH